MMGSRFAGKTVFITGGGSGIGRGIGEAMAAEGANVVAAGLTLAKTEEVARGIQAAGGQALGVAIDVADSQSVEAAIGRAIERFGQIDILVNNAGLSVGDTILDFDETAWDRNLDVVLKGIYLCSRQVLPGMIERGSGVILNVGSVNGLMGLGESAYSAAKAGMINSRRIWRFITVRKGCERTASPRARFARRSGRRWKRNRRCSITWRGFIPWEESARWPMWYRPRSFSARTTHRGSPE
ncbi:MAG: SDR family NAD(P)-dependent oxidoreductase [Thermomicrobiales bacterium]